MNRTEKLGLSKEQKKIYNRRRKLAKEYFNLPKGWVLHHVDTNLFKTDIDRYIMWNIEDLVPMTKAEHNKLHLLISNPSSREDVKDKIRKSKTGKANIKIQGANHPKAIKVRCINTGECFDTIEMAVSNFGFASKSAHCKITKCCKGERKHYKGYFWEYA